ncbi:MAG: site-2 protease family protein [Planctomycetota bacterium]
MTTPGIDRFMNLPIYISLPLFILGFGFLVFVHELGHFLAAKAVGIRTTQFAVGFGHAILCYRKGLGLRFHGTEAEYKKRARQAIADRGDDPEKATATELYAAVDELGLGETEYRLNWIPLGGYVKMLGQEDMDPNARSDDPRAYNNKSVGARAIVISAGVVMNLIVGAVFFIAAFTGGVNFPPNIVGGVIPGAPAATTYAQGHDGDPAYLGLLPGDRVVEADGDVVRDLTGIKIAAALSPAGDAVDFVVERPDYASPTPYADPQRLTYRMTPERIAGVSADRGGRLMAIGVTPTFTDEVWFVVRGGDASRAGVEPGMTLTALDGEPIDSHDEFVYRMQRSAGQPVSVTYTDAAGETIVVEQRATPELYRPSLDAPASLLGWSPVVSALAVHDSPAAEAGIKAAPDPDAEIDPDAPVDRAGDLLMDVAGRSWPSASQVIETIKATEGGVNVTVWRDGQRVELQPITKRLDNRIGVSLLPALDSTRVAEAEPGTPAAAVNLPAGSLLRSIAGRPVSDWADIQRVLQDRAQAIRSSPDDASLRRVQVVAELMLAGTPTETDTVELTDEDVATLLAAQWAVPDDAGFRPRFDPILASGPIDAMGLGFEYTVRFIQQTYLTLLRLTQGSVSPTELRGPLGIVDVGAQITREGWTKYLYFLALISVNLAVLNFLPIPITDGGHIVYLLIEKFTGKPPAERVIQWATLAGLALLATVFVFVTYQDILRLVGLSG